MIISNIDQFKMGWFVGNFEPTIYKNINFEVGHHNYKKGFASKPHTHRVSYEINYIVNGELIASGKHLKKGDMWVYEPNEISDVVFLKDTDLIIIKYPSLPEDKVIV